MEKGLKVKMSSSHHSYNLMLNRQKNDHFCILHFSSMQIKSERMFLKHSKLQLWIWSELKLLNYAILNTHIGVLITVNVMGLMFNMKCTGWHC